MRGAGLDDCADGGGHHLLPAPNVGFGGQPIFNNHIPVDPYIEQKISITKTSPLINVTRGQLVPYTITVKNTLRSTLPLWGSSIRCQPVSSMWKAPAASMERRVNQSLTVVNYGGTTSMLAITAHTVRLLLVVGAGVTEGKYVNQAQVINIDTNSHSPR